MARLTLNKKYPYVKSGSALLLTMFIMAGMLIVAISGSSLVLAGIKAGGIQAQSTKAYFAAEAGSERLLWELRKNSYYYSSPSTASVIFSDTLSGGTNYQVYFTDYPPLIFRSVGEYQNNRRSVELRM